MKMFTVPSGWMQDGDFRSQPFTVHVSQKRNGILPGAEEEGLLFSIRVGSLEFLFARFGERGITNES